MERIKGLVVCPQPRAADAGAAVLRGGGNAFDAAIATAFCQMVQDPFMGGLGGMGTLQFFEAGAGRHGMVDFHARAGAGVRADMWAADSQGRSEISGYALFEDFRAELGYGAIMTPGTVAGLAHVHAQFCTRDWAHLLQPAIRMAREGVVVTPFFHDFLARAPQPGLPDGLRRVTTTPACAALYLDAQGALHRVGDTLRHPEMAVTLQRLAEKGAADFYQGAIAARIAEDFAAHDAFVTAADLAAYRVREEAPVIGSYRGHRIASNPPPGSGAVLIAMLNILENFDLSAVRPGSLRHYDLVARAMAAAHEDREAMLADPEFHPVPVAEMMSKARAADWAAKIRAGWLPGHRPAAPPSCTTHVSAWDAAGNCVSLTHTLGTGSGVVTPGLGFNWNNAMKLFDMRPGRPNSMAPGKARTTGMVPTLVFKDDAPWMIVGAPGGSVIISAVLTTILNAIDFGMGAVEAVSFPRIHCEAGPVFCEARVQEDVVAGLRALGHTVRHSPLSYDPGMSRAHAILLRDGVPTGGADPRGGGGVAFAY
ncbi:gamma-glutamyltransferase [Falsiroseomonas selenitidurans]|uniref:Glutathione hydrolase proenzyme n=1 Tax=Falsiroseomonas selenitidurans TaxID=2716335 RepID=A0ABX1E9N8_9PROT|nr:gamma-glutamyltransferase [Falsiroseomonas selenitidurans]NKC33538.1 gamma-glutamyltransferase [Falsiroseomonas selenitidurans]